MRLPELGIKTVRGDIKACCTRRKQNGHGQQLVYRFNLKLFGITLAARGRL